LKKLATIILTAIFAGCSSPHDYQDPVDPNVVTVEQLAEHAGFLEERYQQDFQVNGIIWQRYYTDVNQTSPDLYGSGGDSCLFTASKLAADVFRYQVTGESSDLDAVLQSLRGVYILTHITGTPGVLCRAAFPIDRADEWAVVDGNWAGRDPEFVHISPTTIADPFNPGGTFPAMMYYTRATKDQLSGLLYGLSVTWKYLKAKNSADLTQIEKAKEIVAKITESVFNHLDAFDFNIRDENGSNDTTADDVDGLLLSQLLAVYRATVRVTNPARQDEINKKYDEEFDGAFYNLSDLVFVFTNYNSYFSWNLRHMRAHSIYMLETDTENRDFIREWFKKKLWKYVAGHLNSKFIYIQNAVNPTLNKLDKALFALKSLSLKPLRSYPSPLGGDIRSPNLLQALINETDQYVLVPHLREFTHYSIWQKEPWDTGKARGSGHHAATGGDFLLAYWMGRFYGFTQ